MSLGGTLKTKIILVALVWLVLLAIGVSIWRLWLAPTIEQKREEAKELQQEEIERTTSGSSRYERTITIGADAFSGYAVLRSDAFAKELAKEKIRLKVEDDGADYSLRLDGLASGAMDLAAFPVDALLTACEASGQTPATIIAIIDETSGADAMLANKTQFPKIDALDNSDLRFVLVGNSPSETLARVVMSDFDLSNLADDPFVRLNSPEEVVRRYRNSDASTQEAYVLWEPYVSQVKGNPAMHVLIDSSTFTGYIVDSLVVNRDFLAKQPEIVDKVLRAYFRALFEYRESDKLKALVRQDAKNGGTELSDAELDALIGGIRWRTTLDNFTYFGLRDGALPHIEDILIRVNNVLQKTGGLASDPTNGKPNRLFYERSIANLQSSDFYPDQNSDESAEKAKFRALSDQQWERLVPVGTIRLDQLVFARGSARLSSRSEATLQELIEKLNSWPRYYLSIQGNAASRGNMEANRKLAAQRAQAALEYLLDHDIEPERLRAEAGDPSGQTKVSFVVKQMPF